MKKKLSKKIPKKEAVVRKIIRLTFWDWNENYEQEIISKSHKNTT